MGTVWRVNRKSRKIIYTGRRLGNKYTLSTDLLNKTKHGFKSDEYFLVFPDEKYQKGGANLGIL